MEAKDNLTENESSTILEGFLVMSSSMAMCAASKMVKLLKN